MMRADRIIILNVDDYEAGRYATSRILQQAGYEVVEAESGEQALRLAAGCPDLIVLDVNLPDIDGFEVCRRIKSQPETSSIPVLYLSAAYRELQHRVQGLEMGAEGYLTQPVDPRELVATVGALLRARHVRDAVHHSEERFRSLMMATSDIIWTTGPEGQFVTEQPDWTEFTGQETEQLTGWGWLRAVHPEDRARTAEIWARALEDRGMYETEHRLRHRSGEYRYMVVRAVPVLEPDGSVREWVGAHTDITERKRAEQSLRDQNQRLRFLADAANRLLLPGEPREYAVHLVEGLADYLRLDVHLVYLRDEARQKLVLVSRGGIDEATASRLVGPHPAETAAADPRADAARSAGVTAHASYPLLAGDRPLGTVWLGTRSRPRFTADELSLMQAVCNQIAVALERAELISALQERARLLEEANRAKSDFLATMSHELRTPLNAMVGYADLLLAGVPEPIPGASRAQVERIRNAALHLTQLIEEVLTHARIEAGQSRLHLAQLDLPELVSDVAALIEPLARQKRLSFGVDHAGAPARVHSDARLLRQILLNLLSNAIKFTEQGEVELTVRQEGEDLVLRVRDTGIGIAPAHLERIFEPFWQVDGSKTRVAGGTGLGLGVVRQLARLLGGVVWAESELGSGSVFTVRLPLRPPGSPAS